MERNREILLYDVPDSILLHIFSFVKAKDLLSLSQLCQRWRSIAYDESLWRNLVRWKWMVKNAKLAPGKSLWRNEYKRLYYHSPLIWSETLTDHTDEVLHISFSHNGSLFSTTSKDCTVKVWEVGYPTVLKYNHDFRADYHWDFTQFSRFNDTDTMLLVSSVKTTELDRRGYVAVLSIQHNFELLRVVSMDPSQLFGTWLNNNTFLGGSLEISLDRFATTVQIQAFEVKDVILRDPSGRKPTYTIETHAGLVFFTFCSETASLIKFLTVVNTPSKSISPIQEIELEQERDLASSSEMGASQLSVYGSSEEAGIDHKKILTNGHGLETMMDSSDSLDSFEESMEEMGACSSKSDTHQVPRNSSSLFFKNRNLIYVTGEFAVALHQLGFKDISPETVSDILVERTLESSLHDFDGTESHMVVNYSNQDIEMRRMRKPDSSDHMIDLNGHVTGLCLSHDHRYLFVNCRPWVGKIDRSDPWATPELSSNIEVRVIDLERLKDTGIRYLGHKGFSCSTMCCFVFLDTSQDYVGSGSEDAKGYLWDKHYCCCLGTFEHDPGVVNAVGFNCQDQEYFVTVSDDQHIKVWRSRNRMKELQSQEPIAR